MFYLRKLPSFPEICRRLSIQRDLRSAYFEIMTVRVFVGAGFAIDMRPEVGVRGEDFDFLAKRRGLEIAVEATALKERPFSANAIGNSLGNKRDQLPADIPGVFFCMIPMQWPPLQDAQMEEHIDAAVGRFLGGTERVNLVVVTQEQHIDGPQPGTGALMMAKRVVTSRRPRHSADLSFLIGQGSMTDAVEGVRRAGQAEFDAMVAKRRVGEFYDWVDYLVP